MFRSQFAWPTLAATGRSVVVAALGLGLLGGAPAQAAPITSVTSPGPLALTIGTAAPLPAVVGQPVQVGLSVTNTTADPIGPFSYGVQVGPSAKLTANFPGVHVCARPGNSFSCDFLGQLQPGLTDNAIGFTVVPQTAGLIDLTAAVQPILGSSAPTNSVHLVLNAVAPVYDLQVSQSASSNSPAAGSAFAYTFRIKNTGPATAPATTVTDTLPGDAVALGAAASNGGACTVAGQAVSCQLGDAAAGSSVTVTVNALAPTRFGSYTNTGAVAAAGPDANPGNNSASTTITIR